MSHITRATVEGATGSFQNSVRIRGHELEADEPVELQGTDTGPNPFEYLLAALGACTSMTLSLYAKRKGWPLERVRVELSHESRGQGQKDHVERQVTLEGPLSDEQRQRLLEIADKCPVHRTLTTGVEVASRLETGDPRPAQSQ